MLVDAPPDISEDALLILALHGYGQNAEVMLGLARRMFGARDVIAALEAPNQHYFKTPGPEIGFNWGTRAHWESNVRFHHAMLLAALGQTRDRFGLGPERSLLVGFSQPVGLNYRFAATHPGEVRGVIGICGGVPKDWESGAQYQPVTAALLHIAREEDEFYDAEVTRGFPERLRTRAADVEYHLLPGAHRFPSKAGHIVGPWVARVFSE